MKYLLSILLFSLLPSITFAASPRTALIIGNSSYKLMPLTNPENDAEDIAEKLKTLGFEVIFAKNKSKSGMKTLIREFGAKLKQKGGVGLFFYAGHGLQIDGQNYLVPVDFNASVSYEVADSAVNSSLITGAMEEAENPLNIILLDACRDNPFPRKNRSSSRGLARMDSASGTIIAYSTSPGDVAADGEGRNSPYTENLLKHMGAPGLTIEQVFKRVRVGVEDYTGGRQLPWETSSLRGDFYFEPGQILASPIALPAQVAVKEKLKPQATRIPVQEKITPLTKPIAVQEIIIPQVPAPQIQAIVSTSANARKLSIFTNPQNSIVKLLNSDKKYAMGVKLEPGDYRIEISKEGFRTKQQWVTVDTENLEMQITLVPDY